MAIATSRTIQVLEILAQSSAALGVVEIAAQSGLSRASLSRLLGSLVDEGVVLDEERRGRYRLSLWAWGIGARLMNAGGLRSIAAPHLIDLCHRLGTTVNLSLLEGREIVYVEGFETFDGQIHTSLQYQRRPCLATASGRAVAAHLPAEEISALLEADIPHFTSATCHGEALARSLQVARQCGYATIDREVRDDLSGVALPLFSATGRPVAAIGLPRQGPLDLVFVEKAVDVALVTARRVSADLGYRAANPTHIA